MRRLFILIYCVAWVAFVPPARAQWICNITDSSNFDQSTGYYWFSALSCKGNNVAVAANVDTLGGNYLAFLISTNGGISWSSGNQGLPGPTWDHNPIITSIDQIDSLNIVAFGDSDLLVRTTDGGATWQELTSPTNHIIEGISFSDPMHGILVAADTVHGTYITTNGGVDWSAAPFTRAYGWQCHDYGNGMYRILSYGFGVVYTTKDDWNTVDSTGSIITDSILAEPYVYEWCSFGAGDTMIAYGNRYTVQGHPYPCIARTTDGGKKWASVYDDTSSFFRSGWVSALSDINRDTIIAGIDYGFNNTVLWSTDRGETWRYDTLIFHDSNYPGADGNWGVGFNSAGDLLGAYTLSNTLAVAPVLVIGQHSAAGVPSNNGVVLYAKLFPNPATTSLTLTGADAGHTVHLLDILGRAVLEGKVPASGTLTLDVSHLPRGIYMAMIERDGAMLPAGRIVLVGE
ncbi:MAG TPA: T9SS type A sorting domain-containing protein [Candidatus Kapabacteria bacterium]|nr:T9SS type A sorting domain-containing protein [Candidatus Kapabacteria bacterium]